MSHPALTRACFLLFVALLCGSCSRGSEYYVTQGNQLQQEGKHEDALISYRKALQEDPNNGEAWRQMGLLKLKLRKVTEAYQDLSRAAELTPRVREVQQELADLTLAAYMGDRRRPEELRLRLEKIASDLEEVDRNDVLAVRIRAYILLLNGRPNEALELLRANPESERDPGLRLGIVQALADQGNVDAAVEKALLWLEESPEEVALYGLLANLYQRQGKLIDAEKILRARVEKVPSESVGYVELARFLNQQRRRADARAALAQLTEPEPKTKDAYLTAARFQLAELRDAAGARQLYEKGLASDPQQANDYLKRLAELDMLEGRPQDAIPRLEKVLAAAPEDQQAFYLTQSLAINSGRPEEIEAAVKALSERAERRAQEPEVHYWLAVALNASGNRDAAFQSANRAAGLDRTYVAPVLLMSEISLARRDLETARRHAETVLNLEPDNYRAQLVQVSALIATGQTSLAGAPLRKLMREAPNSLDVQLQQALLLAAEKKYAQAEANLSQLIRASGRDTRPAEALARVLLQQGKAQDALKLVNRELERTKAVSLRYLLGEVALAAGQPLQALANYQALAQAVPGAVEPRLLLGRILQLTGDHEAALKEFQQAGRIAPDDLRAAFLEATALELLGRRSQAEAGYRKVLQADPNHNIAANNLAFLLAESGKDLDEAMQLASGAVRRSNQAPGFVDTLGYVYLKKNDPKEANRLFLIAARQDPANATYKYHVGLSLMALGDKDQAQNELQAALAASRQPDEQAKIRQALQSLGGS